MELVLQRVKSASVRVDGETVGACQRGFFLLLGVREGDTEADAEALCRKMLGLRVFPDENDRMNLSVKDIGGGVLVVSQFTLLASYRKGNRPDFLQAAKPDEANRLYEYFVSLCEKELSHVGKGVFGAHMEISSECDGPVTICMKSEVLLGPKKEGERP